MSNQGRMTAYPTLEVVEKQFTKDAHGNVTGTTEVTRELPFVVHLQTIYIDGAQVTSGAWFLLENEVPNMDYRYVFQGREFAVAGYNTFNDYGIIHYQVFLK